MNRKQIVAIIQRGYFTDGDLADALLAELAKVIEPVGYIASAYREVIDGKAESIPMGATMSFINMGWKNQIPLYTHPLPQLDLVAEIERLGNELKRWPPIVDSWHNTCDELRQQLSAAQSRIELLEHDAKTGDYETLYAQTVVELSVSQASETELLTELEKVVAIMEYTENDVRFPCVYESATKTITTHKARKDKG